MEDPVACGAMKPSPARRAFRLASSEVESGITKPKPSRCMVRRPTSMLRGIRSQILDLGVLLRRWAGADGRGRASLHLLQILLFQYPPMMQFVASDDVSQGSPRDLGAGGQTDAGRSGLVYNGKNAVRYARP